MTLAVAAPEQVRDWLAQSLERSPCGSTLEDIAREIRTGAAHLWVGEESAAVTFPEVSARIWHAGGEFRDLVRLLDRAERAWRTQGIARIVIDDTRKGWERVLAPYGFNPTNGLEKLL
jgi:hypothetical protein